MELATSNIQTLEQLILQSDIPYEDVKIELIDHLATEIEIRMEASPSLTFGEAIRLSSRGLTTNIHAIRKDIEESVIKSMIRNTLDFSNPRSLVLVAFFSVLAYGFFSTLGAVGAPIIISLLFLSTIAIVLGRIRLGRARNYDTIAVKIRRTYFWIPVILAATICGIVSTVFREIIWQTNFWSYIDAILLIPIALSYGLLLKTMWDTIFYNVHQLNAEIKLDERLLAAAR